MDERMKTPQLFLRSCWIGAGEHKDEFQTGRHLVGDGNEGPHQSLGWESVGRYRKPQQRKTCVHLFCKCLTHFGIRNDNYCGTFRLFMWSLKCSRADMVLLHLYKLTFDISEIMVVIPVLCLLQTCESNTYIYTYICIIYTHVCCFLHIITLKLYQDSQSNI